jgi:hypothetical protein
MPIRSYFLYIGGLLLALLFLADWYLPPSDAERSRSDVDRSTIRIHSAQKWPQAVVIDTTQPTIVPPRAATVAAAPPLKPSKPAREAYAMATEPERAAKPAEPVKEAKPRVRRTRTARAPAIRGGSRIAGPPTFGYGNNMFAQPRRQMFAFRNDGFGSRGFWPMSW